MAWDDKFQTFSNKFRFMTLFMTLTIAIMHLSYFVDGEDKMVYVFRLCSAGAMGWFFFSSAFWYFCGYSIETGKNKFLKRLKTLLLPYVVWNMLRFLHFYGIDILRAGNMKNHWKLLIESLLFIQIEPYSYTPIIPGLWYIIRLLSYFLFAPIIFTLLKNRIGGIITIFITFLLTRNGEYFAFEGWLCVFEIGAYIAINFREEFIAFAVKSKIGNTHKVWGTGGVISLYAILILVWIYMFKSGKGMWMGVSYLAGATIAILPIMLFRTINLNKNWSSYSFVIYCSHTLLAPILNKVIFRIADYIPISKGIHTIILLILVVGISITLCEISRRYLPTIYRCLTGGR